MAGKRFRSSRSVERQGRESGTPPTPAAVAAQIEPDVASALEETQRVRYAPLVDLVDAEERADVEHLNREALAVPAMARLRDLVAFVGAGRPGTQSGNLKPTQLAAAAAALGLDDAPFR